jgi:anaerobic magnesium-protoporphyrin IX monomethyl ester cyclase
LPVHGKAEVQESIDFKVAMVRSPGPYTDWDRQPSLGLAYLSGYLKANGIACRIFDARYHAWTVRELVERITEYQPHLIGLTAMTHEVKDAGHLAQRLKSQLSVPVVIGGAHATALPRRTMSEFPVFDYGVNGEGEKPFLNLVSRLRDGHRNPKYLDGIVHWDKHEVTINAHPPVLTQEEFDELPLPDFEDYYEGAPDVLKASGASYIIAATRGTYAGDLFSLPVIRREARWRSPERVIKEIEHAVFRGGAHTFDFCDEGLVSDAEESKRILEAMAGSDLLKGVKWKAAARPGQISPETIRLAGKAGCRWLRMDIGSGVDDILAATRRDFKVDQVRVDVDAVRSAGIGVELYFKLGCPGETVKTIAKTAGLVAEMNPDSAVIDIVIPYPGTGIREMALRGAGGYRLLSDDWSRYAWYGGGVLELQGLPYKKLAAWQRRALVMFYLKNGRTLELIRYLWVRRSTLGFVVSRKLGIRLVPKERFTG